jgi:hypothetical protein
VETYYATVPPTSTGEQQELAEDPMIKPQEPDLSMYNDERLVSQFDKESGFVSPNAPGLDATDDRPGDYLTDKDKEAMRQWKQVNPNDTIKHQRDLLEHGKISHLPWEDLKLQPDNVSPHAGTMLGFGTAFPTSVIKGDTFLRVDRIPSALYKFNGSRWIEVDKSLSDQYAYDTAYIDHLINKIESGEYDPELLSSAEQDQIEHRLKHK